MVKNGHKASFVYWSLVWTCLTGNLDHFERRQITEFQQILKKTEFSHNTLRLHLARLELKGTQARAKTCSHLKTGPKPENKNYDHFTPISGQGSAPETCWTFL